MGNSNGETLSQVLGGLLKDMLRTWKTTEGQGMTLWRRIAVVWMGAFAFSYPMFIVHFQNLVRDDQFEDAEMWFILAVGFAPCALFSGLPAWLVATEGEGQTKVRLFMSGFLLPYAVFVLLVPLMRVNGGGP